MAQTETALAGEAERARQFAFHHTSWWLNALKHMPRLVQRSGITVDDQTVRVRMRPGGEVVIGRGSVDRVWRTSAGEQGITFWLPLPIGIHTNFRSTWWLTSSSRNLVAIDMDSPAAGRVWGVPVRPKRVVVSLEDPDGFIAELLG